MHHAQMGDEGGWQPHTSGLEGRQDEWKSSRAPPARPAAALPLRRWPSAPNVRDVDLATRLQLERVELLMPDLDGDTAACEMCRPCRRLGPEGRRGRVRRRGVSPIGSEKKCVTNSQIHVSYACRQSDLGPFHYMPHVVLPQPLLFPTLKKAKCLAPDKS